MTDRQDDGSVVSHLGLNGVGSLSFKASGIRRERTGVHAQIAIILNSTLLAHDEFNVGRNEERVRIVNSALAAMGGAAAKLNKLVVKHELDMFALDIWPTFLGGFASVQLCGDSNPSRPCFLLEPYIVQGAGTIMFGPPERAKSFTALLWAVSVDAGINDFWPVSQTPCLYLNLERSAASISRRLARVNMALGLDPTRPLWVNNARGRSLNDVADELRRMVTQGVGCIFADSISRAGLGDLTENQPANRIVDLLNGLGCAWVGIAHSPRGDDSHLFGSVHFDAGADVTVRMITERAEGGDVLGVGLKLDKKNDLPDYPMQILAYEFDRDYGLSLVRPALRGEFLEIEGKQKLSMARQVEDFLRQEGSATASEMAEALGFARQSLSTLLGSDKRFVKLPRDKHRQPYGLRARHSEMSRPIPPRDAAPTGGPSGRADGIGTQVSGDA